MSRKTQTRVRATLRACGIVLSVIALAWIGLRFVRSGASELLHTLPVTTLQLAALLLTGAVGYAVAMCLPALAWWRLVAAFSPHRSLLSQTMATYAVTQYGKYLPGNVAHYALRHALSRRNGVPHSSLGIAALLEALLLLLAALTLSLTAPLHALGSITLVDARIAVALLLTALAALWLTLRWARRRGGIGTFQVPHLPLSVLLACTGLYLAFFVASAALLAGLARVLGVDIASYAQLLAANSASWSAGFVIVGAPAGLGVRETAFVALATPAMDEKHALLLIGLFRVITFLGDTVFLAAGTLLLRRNARRSAESVS